MARNITVTFDDGSTHVYQNAPDDVTPDQVSSRAQSEFGKAVASLDGGNKPSLMDQAKQEAGNAAAGLVRGAGSIGATILTPFDAAARAMGIQNEWIGRTDRRQAMDDGLQSMGADPDSLAYKGGKFTAEVAGTAGVGGAIAKGAQAVRATPTVVRALASGGMSGGGNLFTRAGAGAVTGAATAGLVNPEDAKSGAAWGAAFPVLAKAGGVLGQKLADASKQGARSLMQSSVKPTLKQLQTGEADVAIDTLLKYGLSPNQKGVEKLKMLVGDKNTQIADLIANSKATIGKQDVINYLDDTRNLFSRQVSPTSDLSAIQNVADDFAKHPSLPGPTIPVQQAQQMKQGTYKVLNKKYGQLGGAETEAQKALARGLKEEIARVVPEVGPLNAEEAKLLSTLKVTERRAYMDMNKNPMGLAALAASPGSWAAFMADRSAGFKALTARQLNKMSQPGLLTNKATGLLELPVVRGGLLLTSGS